MSNAANPPRDPGNRDQRLREALRANLKRRKAQARGRTGPPAGEGSGDEARIVQDTDRAPGDDIG